MVENADLTMLGLMNYGIIATLIATLIYGTKYLKSIQAVASADPVLAKIIIQDNSGVLEQLISEVQTQINEVQSEYEPAVKQEAPLPINNVLWNRKTSL